MAPVTAQDALRVRAEIVNQLGNLSNVAREITKRRPACDDTTTYAIALLLMNYYTGVEHVLRHIARQFGGLPPAGEHWHQQLLSDAALDIEGVRPPVLSAATAETLGRLLRFRHIVRNLYAWTLRRAEMDALVGEIEACHASVQADLGMFGEFLMSLAKG